jgi:hypothetical protein
MGLLDHTRTWHFETSMSPARCVRTFAASLSARTGSVWRVATGGDGTTRSAVATYNGRAGMAAGRGTPEPNPAAGSQLTFTATAGHDGTTSCTMAMIRTTKVRLFFTADARYFRAAMNRVARDLRDSDAGLDLLKR